MTLLKKNSKKNRYSLFCTYLLQSKLILQSADSSYQKVDYASEGFEITDFAHLDFTSTTKEIIIPLKGKPGVIASIMVEVKLKFPEEEKQIKALQMDPEQRVLRERMDKIESEVRIVK